jgi:asparagine synthase (glutamine-hydrolysing)
LFTKEAQSLIQNGNGLNVLEKYRDEVSNETEFNRLLYSYYRTYLLEDILVKVDRASMYASLEVRAPFLDYHVVEFISSLPPQYKLHGFTGKRILKELMRGKLPDRIITRPKKGFGIPLSRWLREDLKSLSEELLSDSALSAHGLFDKKYVRKLISEHQSKKHNHRKLIWTLMVFQMWYSRYMK